MARPTKSGLDYFPLATNIFSTGSELMPVIRRYGGHGLGVYLYVLCSIYQNGYYYQAPFFDDYMAEIADVLKADETTVRESLTLLEKIDVLTIFREDDSAVFTSRGVQKRYVEAARNRKHSAGDFLENVLGKYWLLSPDDVTKRLCLPKGQRSEISPELKKNKNAENGFSQNNGGFSQNNGGFSQNNGGFSQKISEKRGLFPEKPYFLSSSLANSEEGYMDDETGSERKDKDEFDRQIKREQEEEDLRRELGLNPQLERARPDDPPVKGPSNFDAEGYRRFVQKWSISLVNTQNYSGEIYEIKWDELSKKIEQSKWVRERLSMDFILRNYTKIMNGRFDDYGGSENPLDALKRVMAKMNAEEAAQNGDTE